IGVYQTAKPEISMERFHKTVTEQFKLLIEAGAKVSATGSKWHRTPLHWAADMDCIFIAELLIKANCKIMPRDKDGKTPLDLAESGDMIKLLKDHGATEN
ncbi:MAG: ankyrin repeat domain-containing protein, partial [Phycisphaerales bacterium]|nr:ankyrin repeat domain-containing protein [Phycisphaerales bacterium]